MNEIRDYLRINAQLAQWLDQGCRHVQLLGVEGQRLLLSGLKGLWEAQIEVMGRAGPELAAAMDAPGLTVVARSGAADGAGLGLTNGLLVIQGRCGDLAAYRQQGGVIAVCGPVGDRAGLEMGGGTLLLEQEVGRLLGERQAGGWIFALNAGAAVHRGRGARGGTLQLAAAGMEPTVREQYARVHGRVTAAVST